MTLEPTRIETDAERAFREAGEALAAKAGTPWRAELLDSFKRNGLPTRHQEAFHYTDVRARLGAAYPPVAPSGSTFPDDDRVRQLREVLKGDIVTFWNGAAEAPDAGTGVVANDGLDVLNALLTPKTASHIVPAGAEQTLIAVHSVANAAHASVHARHTILVKPQARLTLVELHESAGDHLTNARTRIDVEEDASVLHVKLAAEAGAVHLSGVGVGLESGARYEAIFLVAGPSLARCAVDARFSGERARAIVNSIGLADKEEHIDFNIAADHAAPGCTSVQEARIVAWGSGHGVAQSLVRVAPGARGSDSRQMIRGLILGDRAEIDAKPELEILNDDVKASHGTALGDLDPEAIFYLSSRGVPEREARALLIEAFLAEILDKVSHEGARVLLWERARDWLRNSLGTAEAPHG